MTELANKENKNTILNIFLFERHLSFFQAKNKVKKNFAIDAKNPFEYTDKVKEIIETKIIQSDEIEIDLVKIYLANSFFALIPNAIFKEELLNDFAKVSFPNYAYEKLFHKENEQNQLTVVFSCLEDIIFYLNKKFDLYEMNHIADLTLSSISPKSEKQEVFVIFHENEAEIVLYRKKQLVNYSYFAFETNEDLLFHLLSEMKQFGFIKKKSKINFYNAEKNHKDFFKPYLPNLNFSKISLHR